MAGEKVLMSVLDKVKMPAFYATAVVLLTGMATGEVSGAEGEVAAPYYDDIDVDTKVTVDGKIEEVEKDYNLHSETTGKATVRVQDQESGRYAEVEVSQSDEETRATARVGVQF